MGKRGRDVGEVVRGHQFDFVPDGLGFLFGFDEDVLACTASFGLFRAEWDAERSEVPMMIVQQAK